MIPTEHAFERTSTNPSDVKALKWYSRSGIPIPRISWQNTDLYNCRTLANLLTSAGKTWYHMLIWFWSKCKWYQKWFAIESRKFILPPPNQAFISKYIQILIGSEQIMWLRNLTTHFSSTKSQPLCCPATLLEHHGAHYKIECALQFALTKRK